MPTSPGVLAQTLITAWDRIRTHVDDLPPVQPVIATMPPTIDHGPDRWRWDGDTVAGLTISVDTLRQGPDAVLTALLHEAAHVLCWARGIKDTTQRGSYHNRAFLIAAEEVGLAWPDGRPRAPLGYPDPGVSKEAARRHEDDCKALAVVLPDVLPHLSPAETTRPTRADSRVSAECGCDTPRRIRVARTVLAQGPIICGICGTPFK